MLKRIWTTICIILLLNVSAVYAQNYFAVDSLKQMAADADLFKKAEYYNKISWTLRNNTPEKAIEYGKKAIEFAKKSKNYKELAKAYSFTGVAYRNSGDFNQALDLYELGKQVAIKHKLILQQGFASINIANAYIYLEEYDKAIAQLEPAKVIATVLKDTAMMSYYALNKGRALYGQNNIPAAKANIKTALQYRIATKNQSGQSVCYKYLADIYNSENKPDSALLNYNKALNYKGAKFDIDLLADVYSRKSQIYLKKNMINKALTNAKKSINFAKQTQNPIRISSSYQNLANIYKIKKNKDKEIKYLILTMNYRDTMYENLLKEKVAYIKYDSELENNKHKIASLEKEKQLQKMSLKHERLRIVIAFFIVLFVLAILTGAVLLLRQKKKDYALILGKNSIISNQNKELHQKNEEVSTQRDEIEKQKNAIERQKNQIEDSILYAQRIQKAALPAQKLIDELFPYNFVLFMPRDVVSGDFYYFQKINKYIIAITADCTGHGIPGAFVSMLGISLLNEITENKKIISPELILEELRKSIKYSLQQSSDTDSQDDGMDMTVCAINIETLELEFAGANNPLIIVRENEIIELKPNYNPVGIYFREKPFKKIQFQLKKHDTLYMFSDGYADQFGGDENSRFMSSELKKILLSIRKHPMSIQKNMLKQQFQLWKGAYKQIDDVMIVGLKILDIK